MRKFEKRREFKLDLLAQAVVSIAAFDQLPDGENQRNAAGNRKRLRKQMLRKEAGAPASIALQAKRGLTLSMKVVHWLFH